MSKASLGRFMVGVFALSLVCEGTSAAGPRNQEAAPRLSERQETGLAVVVGGLGLGVVGAGFEWWARHLTSSISVSSSQTEASNTIERAHQQSEVGLAFLGLGGLFVLSGVTVMLWPTRIELSVRISRDGCVAIAGHF